MELKKECDCISLLKGIVENGEFPDDSFEIRHIERIDTFEITEDGKARFWISRHPHLFGRPTLGLASSAFIQKNYLYELDFETQKATLIRKEELPPFIDYNVLAMEDVDDFFPCVSSEYEESLKKMATKAEVSDFASKEVDKFSWIEGKDVDNLPVDFKEKYLKEVRTQFNRNMIWEWRYLKNDMGADDEGTK